MTKKDEQGTPADKLAADLQAGADKHLNEFVGRMQGTPEPQEWILELRELQIILEATFDVEPDDWQSQLRFGVDKLRAFITKHYAAAQVPPPNPRFLGECNSHPCIHLRTNSCAGFRPWEGAQAPVPSPSTQGAMLVGTCACGHGYDEHEGRRGEVCIHTSAEVNSDFCSCDGYTYSASKSGAEGAPMTAREPDGYAYRYPDGIRYGTNGRTINGSDPIEAIPFYFAEAYRSASPGEKK
jgi:hypothetical protein